MAEEPVDRQFEELLANLGVVGFNAAVDAIRQPITGGQRIWYCRNREVKFVSHSRIPKPDVWNTDYAAGIEHAKETLEAADDIEVIDKRVFNYLRSGPLSDVKSIHEGYCWAIAIRFDRVFKNGTPIYSRDLKAIPGIGKRRARKVLNNVDTEAYAELHKEDQTV